MHEKKLGVTMLKIGVHHFNFFMRARQNQSYLLEYELRRSNIVHITVTNYKLKCDLLPKIARWLFFVVLGVTNATYHQGIAGSWTW
jgi:hypothetical protein